MTNDKYEDSEITEDEFLDIDDMFPDLWIELGYDSFKPIDILDDEGGFYD